MRASEVGQGDSRTADTTATKGPPPRAFSRDKVARQPHRSVRSDFRGDSGLGSFARWYGMDFYKEGPDRSRRSVEYSWDRPFRTLLTCIKKDKPALPSPLVVHVGRQLRWTRNILALQHFQFNDMNEPRRKRHKHIDESNARHCLSDCGTSCRQFRASEDTEQFLSELLGTILQPSLGSRFPKRIYCLGFDCAFELFEEFADGNARQSR